MPIKALRRSGIAAKHILCARAVRTRLEQMHGCRANIGCGGRPTTGWVNLDVNPRPGVFFWDCRRGLPFSDNSVAAIFSEHTLEHLDAENEGRALLRECWRCLHKGGVIRVVVPDAGAYLRAYAQGWGRLAAMRPLQPTGNGWRDAWLGDVYRTPMQFINAVFRQHGEHKYAYDEETLALLLQEAGFSQVVRQRFGSSIDRNMAPDTEARRSESLYIEAVK